MKEERRYEITCPTLGYMIKCLKVSPFLLITYLSKKKLCLWVYLLKTEIDFNSRFQFYQNNFFYVYGS